jgi:hypothetical protein
LQFGFVSYRVITELLNSSSGLISVLNGLGKANFGLLQGSPELRDGVLALKVICLLQVLALISEGTNPRFHLLHL